MFRLHIVAKTVFALTARVFFDVYLPEYKAILPGILYRPPTKLDFVKHINDVFTETRFLDKQKCYLLGDLNINQLLDEKEISGTNDQNLSPLRKGYLDFCFSFFWNI